MSNDISTVTDLVQDLVRRISANRASREQIATQATELLEQEEERLRLAGEYGLPVTETSHAESRNPKEEENLRLKMELQRLNEAVDRSDALVKEYESSMGTIVAHTQEWVDEYSSAREALTQSYDQRVQEEQTTRKELQQDYDNMLYTLHELKEDLKCAKSSMTVTN